MRSYISVTVVNRVPISVSPIRKKLLSRAVGRKRLLDKVIVIDNDGVRRRDDSDRQ